MKTHEIKHCLDAEIEYKFFFSDVEVITPDDYEYIQDLILDGCIEGELIHEGGRGWWKLKNK